MLEWSYFGQSVIYILTPHIVDSECTEYKQAAECQRLQAEVPIPLSASIWHSAYSNSRSLTLAGSWLQVANLLS